MKSLVFTILVLIAGTTTAQELVTCKNIETGEIRQFETWCPVGWQEV